MASLTFCLFFTLFLYSSSHPLDADEILASVVIPDNDGTDGKTMDELILGANSQNGAKSFALRGGDVVVDGDMILSPKQFLASYGGRTALGGAIIKDKKHLWPKRIIPWTMTDDFQQSEAGKKAVYSAMKEWMEKTCIIFTPKGSEKHKEAGHDHNIVIFSGIGCYSRVGYSRGHGVSLGPGCKWHGVAMHELGHTIGLHHEQSRIDRDNYLKVLRQNAPSRPGMQINFDIQKDTDPKGIPYDYCSIMHYGNLAFSTNSKFTILTRNQDYQFTIGNPAGKKHLTFEDAKAINLLYSCNSQCKSHPQCKEPCYVNHKCQCECPQENHCPKRPCTDYNTETEMSKTCEWAKKYNLCRGRADLAKKCAASCGLCEYAKKELGDLIDGGDGGPKPTFDPNAREGPRCKDDRFCDFIAGAIVAGDCVGNNANLVEECPKKCGVCLPCRDKDNNCKNLAAQGKCDSDKQFMYNNCNESCKLCVH